MTLLSKLLSGAFRSSNYIQLYLGSLVAIVAIFGDFFVGHSSKAVYKAVFDNATHALIGGLSWLIVCLNYRNRNAFQSLLEISVCTLLSSLIDLDHFIASRSFHLKDATNLNSRPFLHCSSIPIVLTGYLLVLSYFFNNYGLQKVALIIFTAFGTHHTRDATRRGYWLYPFGHTPPIPYVGYVVITLLIPHIVCFIIRCMNISNYSLQGIIQI